MAIRELLYTMINGRDIDSMTTSEARALVNSFLDKVTINTMNIRNTQHLDYIVNEALAEVGLEQFNN